MATSQCSETKECDAHIFHRSEDIVYGICGAQCQCVQMVASSPIQVMLHHLDLQHSSEPSHNFSIQSWSMLQEMVLILGRARNLGSIGPEWRN